LEYSVLHHGELHTVSLNKKNGKIVASVGDTERIVDVQSISSNWISVFIGNRSFNVYIAESGGKQYISLNGEHYCFILPEDEEDVTATRTKSAHGEAKRTVTAPMPGSVLKIHVEKDETVSEGQCLIIVEAMKMETGLHAAISGRIKRVCVTEGQQVDAGELLIELEEPASSGKI
jgi:biotin carboxyl carrier protein